jgi:hypothetical protein
VDAITLSLAQISKAGELSNQVAAQSIILAAIANTITKGGIVLLGGALPLKRSILPGLLLVLLTALVIGWLTIRCITQLQSFFLGTKVGFKPSFSGILELISE